VELLLLVKVPQQFIVSAEIINWAPLPSQTEK